MNWTFSIPERSVDRDCSRVIGSKATLLTGSEVCTLCGSAILFNAEVGGVVRNFGTSGFLFQSNKLMFDSDTNTLWRQLTGEPVVGELASSGLRLELLPLVLTTWEEWLAQNPDTSVLSLDTGFSFQYLHPNDESASPQAIMITLPAAVSRTNDFLMKLNEPCRCPWIGRDRIPQTLRY